MLPFPPPRDLEALELSAGTGGGMAAGMAG